MGMAWSFAAFLPCPARRQQLISCHYPAEFSCKRRLQAVQTQLYWCLWAFRFLDGVEQRLFGSAMELSNARARGVWSDQAVHVDFPRTRGSFFKQELLVLAVTQQQRLLQPPSE